jgi:hypothetical protein
MAILSSVSESGGLVLVGSLLILLGMSLRRFFPTLRTTAKQNSSHE